MIVIVDYGLSNIGSLVSAFRFLGYGVKVSSDPKEIVKAERLVLPGVGAFFSTMQRLNNLGLSDPLREAVGIGKVPILGICVGMQVLAEVGDEGGTCVGLGLVPGRVKHIRNRSGVVKLPHVGFNSVKRNISSRLFSDIGDEKDFYFLHSYFLETASDFVSATVELQGIHFCAAIEKEFVYGVQFHPEKSQNNGLDLLRNFARIDKC